MVEAKEAPLVERHLQEAPICQKTTSMDCSPPSTTKSKEAQTMEEGATETQTVQKETLQTQTQKS